MSFDRHGHARIAADGCRQPRVKTPETSCDKVIKQRRCRHRTTSTGLPLANTGRGQETRTDLAGPCVLDETPKTVRQLTHLRHRQMERSTFSRVICCTDPPENTNFQELSKASLSCCGEAENVTERTRLSTEVFINTSRHAEAVQKAQNQPINPWLGRFTDPRSSIPFS